jgi:hypothetical protein
MQKINYFRVTTHFGYDKVNNIYIVEHSNNFVNWKKLYEIYSDSELIKWLSDYIVLHNLCDCFHLIADCQISSEVISKVNKDTTYREEETTKTIDFKVIYHRNKYIVIEETSNLPLGEGDELWEADFCIAKEIKVRNIKHYRVFREFQNENRYEIRFDPEFVINMYEKDIKIDEYDNDCDCDDYDDKEITKDLMLDEIISSQRLEIKQLIELVEELIYTNSKLVELLGKK